ncbi:MAG: DUF86 domain-containing protein [Deltaproteobacteria bacterium]|nr:DUF86 domain-containing protein [Deltaproteobacteria bacterium]
MLRPEDRDPAYIWDMLEAARELSDYIAGMRFHDYEQNSMAQAAVERKLEIIGEAAGRVSESLKGAHPQIPWRGMIGLRNVLIHEYGEVRTERVWLVASERIPKLIEMLTPLLPAIPEES